MNVRKASEPIRHGIVKLIAPNVWRHAEIDGLIAVPRPMIRFLADYFPRECPLVGAEIGVAQAKNARSILETLNIQRLYLIDPYLIAPHDAREYVYAKAQLKPFADRVTFIRRKSDDAVSELPLMDFVYIDGRHTYDQVWRDCINYFDKIKDGGVIGGHDFYGDYAGLIRAVLGFSRLLNLPLQTKKADWWIHLKRAEARNQALASLRLKGVIT